MILRGADGGAQPGARSQGPAPYDQFKELWTWALRESGLPIGGVNPIEALLVRLKAALGA